jgi:hypothetical protein
MEGGTARRLCRKPCTAAKLTGYLSNISDVLRLLLLDCRLKFPHRGSVLQLR